MSKANVVRTSKVVASKASNLMRNSASKKTRSVAASALINRERRTK